MLSSSCHALPFPSPLKCLSCQAQPNPTHPNLPYPPIPNLPRLIQTLPFQPNLLLIHSVCHCHTHWYPYPHSTLLFSFFDPVVVVLICPIYPAYCVTNFICPCSKAVGRLLKWKFWQSCLSSFQNGEVQVLHHYHFHSWGDHGVPSTPDPVLFFVQIFQKMQSGSPGAVVVHCR